MPKRLKSYKEKTQKPGMDFCAIFFLGYYVPLRQDA